MFFYEAITVIHWIFAPIYDKNTKLNFVAYKTLSHKLFSTKVTIQLKCNHISNCFDRTYNYETHMTRVKVAYILCTVYVPGHDLCYFVRISAKTISRCLYNTTLFYEPYRIKHIIKLRSSKLCHYCGKPDRVPLLMSAWEKLSFPSHPDKPFSLFEL